MKKTLIALAVASAVPALAQAQTSVTLSGDLKTGLAQTSISAGAAGTSSSGMQMTDGSSKFIISGVEDLGGGLKAIFRIDTRFRPDEAKSAAASLAAVADGATWVGLEGGFGQVRLGRIDQHYIWGVDEHAARATPLQHWSVSILSHINSSAIANTSRTPNLLRWDSANIAGFTVGLGYSTAAFTYDGCPAAPSLTAPSPTCGLGDLAKGNGINANAQYMAGPLRAGITYWNAYNEPKTVQQKSVRGWADYNLGIVQVGVTVDQSSLTAAGATPGTLGAETKRMAWSVPVKASVGPGTLLFTYSQAQDAKVAGTTAANTGAKFTVIGYDYPFSKRTSLGVSYAKLDNATGASYSLFTGSSLANLPAVTAGQDISSFTVGLRHAF
jgi:predicted porin